MERVQRRIRLKYAGFINFVSNLISIFTGMMYVTMTSRKLNEELFGLWHYLGVILQYFVIPTAVTNYWLTRYSGRGFRVGKIGLFVNSCIMIISLSAFLALAPLTILSYGDFRDLPLIVLILSFQLPAEYYTYTLNALASGVAPQLIGYGQLIIEFIKLVAGYYLIICLGMGLPGALLAFVLAKYFSLIFMFIKLREEFSGKLDFKLALRWIKLWWLPIYSLIPRYLMNFDVVLVALTLASTNSFSPIAHAKAVQTIAVVIMYTAQLHAPLYPKLLYGGSATDVESALNYFLMLAFPMTFGVIGMSKTFLSILRASYAQSSEALIVSSLNSLMYSLNVLFSRILMGIEKVELLETVNFKKYLKSNLFYVPSVNITFYSIYLIVLYLTLNLLSALQIELAKCVSLIVFLWFTIKLTFTSLIALFLYHRCRVLINLRISMTKITKYIAASIIMLVILLITGVGQIITTSFMYALKMSIAGLIIGATTYTLIMLIIEPEARLLFKLFLKKICVMITFDSINH